MNLDHLILTLIVFFPLLGAAMVALLPERGRTVEWGALAVALGTFALTLHLPFHYTYGSQPAFQFEQNIPWIAAPAIRYHVGVDGMSMWLVVLTGLLAPIGVLVSWRAISSRKRLFYVLFLLQQVAMMGIFVSLDMLVYYGFWELSLVPMTLLIATFGRTENRRRAAIKYFLYAFIPSALLLVGMLWVYAQTSTFDVPALMSLAAAHGISANGAALWLASLAFLLAFAVKVPVFPLHGWLGDAFFEGPTAAIMILAGKTALYSMVRFSFGLFPAESHRIAPLMIALGAIGIVYGALLALVQIDIKRLAAYATLGHLSFIVVGLFTFTSAGLNGGIYQILNESLAGAAFLILIGLLYERYDTYELRQYGGLAARHPWMVTMFVITGLAMIGLPMLNGFVGEFLILSGSMQTAHAHHIFWTALATLGVILSAAYMLTLIQRIFYGEPGPRPRTAEGWDLDGREHAALWPLAALFLVMGVLPTYWLRSIDAVAAPLAVHQSSTPDNGAVAKVEGAR